MSKNQAYHQTAVREMPSEERPRERLARLGAPALRDAELLAILFRTGTKTLGAVALAESLLRHFESVRGLERASLQEIKSVPGIGEVKAVEIKAALELGKRLIEHREHERPRMRNAEDFFHLLRVRFKSYEVEHFKVVLLNTKNEVLKIEDLSSGTIEGVMANPRDVFRMAVRLAVPSVALAHNHPSGDPTPSRCDFDITERLVAAGRLLGINVIEHIIIGDGKYYSMKERRNID